MDYTTLTESLEKLAKIENTQSLMNDADRVRLMEAARAVSLKFEMPFETYFRLIFSDMEVGLALAGVELGIWKAVADKSPESASTLALASQLGMLEDTLARILRFASTLYMVEEVGENFYRANNITRHFTVERAESVLFLAGSRAVRIGPGLPEFFSRTKMEDPTVARPLPWNISTGSDLSVYEWLAENPRERDAFNDFMFVQTTGLAGFVEKFPLDQYLDISDATNRIQFVDVGGGSGHISRAVLARYPSLYGKIAVEDREDANTVTRSDFSKDGIQNIVHDFFTPQPLKGAKAFYMRNLLHNWTTDKCKVILERLRDAMAPDSVILVDDIVIPPTGSHWYSTHMDLMMLTNHGATERTEAQFADLFDSVGLKRKELVRYNSYGPAIQAVVRK
ncbi:hypothetical protein AJ79_09821 [Helicocarpus griseus UAMH5409]|uniref:O-methyltransferase C-terminal domain-containing protein n=1 Tax=Helicocarpus griseus UAMH5409 TaxID=1447875 RepID=A0A2B7WHB2_9EURO|nr:hypothetical protein AJ79_09821 [Helicocarpus griseus UAMH5409]